MRADDIRDVESFEVWLRELPEQVMRQSAGELAVRSALRAFPKWYVILDAASVSSGETDGLPIMRALLIATVMFRKPAPAIFELGTQARVNAKHLGAYSFRAEEIEASWSADAAAETMSVAIHGIDKAIDVVATSNEAVGLWQRFWSDFQADASRLQKENCLLELPLWYAEMPESPLFVWEEGRAWLCRKDRYAFWIRWYDAILAGRPLTGDWDSHWDLLHDIALIPDADWDKGAKHLAGLIEEIERQYRRAPSQSLVKAEQIPIATSAVQTAVRVNRLSLPPTLDAIYGHIDLEIRRLSGVNHWPSEQAFEDARALIARLQAMLRAVDELRERANQLPAEPTEADAEAVKGTLSRLRDSLKSWPEDKAEELSDAAWRIGLVGLTTGVFALCGAPALVGAGIGGMFFGSKHLEQGAKAIAAMKAVSLPETADKES